MTVPDRLLPALSVLVLASLAALGAWAVADPYQASYVEGYLLEQGVRLAEGGALYQDLSQEPYVVDNFPPLYPLLMALGATLFGPSFAFGRVLTLVAVAGLGAVAWRFHRALPPAQRIAWIALWAASPFVLRRALLVRMDFAAILLAALGVGIYLQRRDRNGAWLAAPVFALAVLTRQTMLVAPAALVVAVWLHGRRRDAWILAGALGGILIAALLAIEAWMPGAWQHMVRYNMGRYDIGQAALYYGRLLWMQTLLVVLGGWGAWVSWRDGLRGRVLATWWVVAAAATVTVGKPGSTYNHFLELLFVSLLVAPAGFDAARRAWSRHRSSIAQPAALLVGLLLVQAVVTATAYPTHTAIDALADRDDDAALIAALRDIDGTVVSENAGAAVLAGHDLVIEPRTLLELELAGAWDPAPFVASIENRSYAAFVIETFHDRRHGEEGMRFGGAAWAAIQNQYRPEATYGDYRIWRPA